MLNCIEENGIKFYRVNSDYCGNPRYVVHFLDIETYIDMPEHLSATERYNIVCKFANKIGGRKYTGKNFGGGIVFQSYNIAGLAERIKEIDKK